MIVRACEDSDVEVRLESLSRSALKYIGLPDLTLVESAELLRAQRHVKRDGRHSCRHLRDCVTEFGAQGLELDGVLLAWGTDLLRDDDRWSNAYAKRHARGQHVRDPFQLRLNAYRVLLTRGRDCCIAYVPPLRELDATAGWLQGCGVRVL